MFSRVEWRREDGKETIWLDDVRPWNFTHSGNCELIAQTFFQHHHQHHYWTEANDRYFRVVHHIMSKRRSNLTDKRTWVLETSINAIFIWILCTTKVPFRTPATENKDAGNRQRERCHPDPLATSEVQKEAKGTGKCQKKNFISFFKVFTPR